VPPSPYQAVVFDFGGVLITPITNRIGELAARHGVTMETLLYVLMGPREESTPDHPWHRAERGEIPVSDFQELVTPWADEVGIALQGDEFDVILDGVFAVHDDVVARIVRLRAEGYRTALLTNSFREFRAHLESRVDFSIFDVVIDSSEVGCRKPEPEVYVLSTELVGVDAGAILYLDDFLANVDGAIAAGWDAIHVVDPGEAMVELDRRLAARTAGASGG
jgi:putative hydrolase of the HAD superfamily